MVIDCRKSQWTKMQARRDRILWASRGWGARPSAGEESAFAPVHPDPSGLRSARFEFPKRLGQRDLRRSGTDSEHLFARPGQ